MFEKLNSLKTYEAGKPIELVVRDYGIDSKDIIKLASNENPYGPPPKAIEKIKNLAAQMHRYPDDSFFELKDALSEKFSIKPSNIIIGAGSDQILEFAVYAVNPKKVLMAGITFAMYEIYSKQVGAKILKTKSITHNLDEFYKIYKKEKPEVIFLCVPNNPLGECLDAKDVFDFIEKIDEDTLIVVDGAYQEFAAYKDKNMNLLSFKDNCGFGLLASIDNIPSHKNVEDAVIALERMMHRGAIAADGKSGDGSGLLFGMPDKFMRKMATKEGIDLPET